MSGDHAPAPEHTNRLIHETSPYLLQHAHNPVDWYPWGPEALERARSENRPILLSIGYSACHWCHVMAHESFENPAIAAQMNRDFVSIKVDREERPDLDAIYMQAVQALNNGQGGWPMTVFLTPSGSPFWGGTYFPPTDRRGMPGFPRVLTALADAWRTRREEVLRAGQELDTQLRQGQLAGQQSAGPLDTGLLDAAARGLLVQVDPVNGGFGGAPKFPQPMAIEVLLRQWHRTGDESARVAAIEGLRAMASGGIYDHLAGGFHRYSVDAQWLIPHFEKMLYDNAQLARAYVLGYQVTADPGLRSVAGETLDYVLRDMADPGGGFYSTEDADSDGEEGKFYVWSRAQLIDALGPTDGPAFADAFDVSETGTFEHGLSVLHPITSQAPLLLERFGPILREVRARRVRPGRDDKIVTAWNGLMLRTLADAAPVLDRSDLLEAAKRSAAFLLTTMRRPDGRLCRTWKPGHPARINGYLEDYANVADGLTALYAISFDRTWLDAAVELIDLMVSHFGDPAGGFFDTADDHETLITRPKDVFDSATPSGNAVAADVLLRLAVLTDRDDYRALAERTLAPLAEPMQHYPLGFARALSAVDFLLSDPAEVAIVGPPDRPDTRALVEATFAPFLPNKVVAGAIPDDGGAARGVPLLEQRGLVDGRAAAYVCQHYVCQAPVTTPAALAPLLPISRASAR
jgi:uncharacterized protein YyaL (SSP411 family)